MGEFLIMKTMKLLLSIVCYSGTGFVFINQELGGKILDALNINPILQKIILILLIILWIIKILWFVYDKFYLERKERMQKINDFDKKH